jgi:hypothetical protein
MIRKIDVVLFAALSLSCASPSHSPVRANHSNDNVLPRAPVEVALALYFRELRTVQVTSGRDTLRLLLDTGGGHTLVTPEAAHRLGCEPFGRSVGHRMSGERVEFQWCNDIRLLVRDVPLAAARVAVFDLGAVLPPELPSLDGLLSLKSFADHVVTIDMARDRMSSMALGRNETSSPDVSDRVLQHHISTPLDSRGAAGSYAANLDTCEAGSPGAITRTILCVVTPSCRIVAAVVLILRARPLWISHRGSAPPQYQGTSCAVRAAFFYTLPSRGQILRVDVHRPSLEPSHWRHGEHHSSPSLATGTRARILHR